MGLLADSSNRSLFAKFFRFNPVENASLSVPSSHMATVEIGEVSMQFDGEKKVSCSSESTVKQSFVEIGEVSMQFDGEKQVSCSSESTAKQSFYSSWRSSSFVSTKVEIDRHAELHPQQGCASLQSCA